MLVDNYDCNYILYLLKLEALYIINIRYFQMNDNILRQYVDEIFMVYDRDRSGTLEAR